MASLPAKSPHPTADDTVSAFLDLSSALIAVRVYGRSRPIA
jgi:hypothetical protein